MTIRVCGYPSKVIVSSALLLVVAYTISSTSTTNPADRFAVAQPVGSSSSSLANLTSENIEDLEIIQESIKDARENIHSNNTAEVLEELNTISKVLLRLSNDSSTVS